MKTHKILTQIFFLVACAWLVMNFAGCSSSNSLSSVNPAAADPETAINRGDSTASDTTGLTLAPVVNVFASKTIVGPLSEIDLRAEAVDPAGGQVTIAWQAESGTIINTNGSNAIWKAPAQTSSNKIVCIATDVRGTSTKAEVTVEVIGNAVYRLIINADRSSLLTSRITSDPASPFVAVAGARVSIEGFADSGVTDASGAVEFNLDQSNAVASSAQVTVSYYDWEASFVANLAVPEGMRIVDNLTFYPGYDSVTVAIARGDSFQLKRGMLEVTTVEISAGVLKPVAEVYVDAGAAQAVSAQTDGRALVSSNVSGNSEVLLRLARSGYQTIEGYNVPISIDGLTLVRARMAKSGTMPDSQAVISFVRPYNGQTAFAVTAPFVIGFGQPMEKSSIFDNVNLMIENKNTGSLLSISGPEILRKFRVEWVGDTLLKLHPNFLLRPVTRYSLLVSRWEARAADGRMLKNYSGMYGEFVTDIDPSPSIVSTSPKNGDTAVGRNGPFAITFDRPMNTESLYSNLQIEITSLDSNSKLTIDGSSLKSHFSVTWKNGNRVLELVPYRMLRANASYLIRLNKSGLVSESGKAISGFANLWGQFKTAGL